MDVTQDIDLLGKLKEVFGYDKFRGVQESIIKNVIAGKNTFVIMPTGAGKSMCYQLPAIVMEGTAVVISPLIALMKNQVDQLNAFGVNASFLNSTLSKGEITKVKKAVLAEETKLLYVAPESLTKEDYINFLKEANLSFVAVDEAHCISEWGHDFRPEYRRIREIIKLIGDLPVIGLTATATPKVQLDIQKNLNMDDATVFKTSFNRSNLFYEVRPKVQIKKQLLQFLSQRKGEAGIIYCLSRKKTEEIAQLLEVNGHRARPYHAGLEANVRVKNQDDFLNENVDIICATIAFGMGIDKPDVRYVVHYDTPKSIEGYYQETGRGGRDGIDGHCLMFYSYNDIVKLEKFNKDKTVTERENARVLLQEMVYFAESSVCRRKQLLHYFGEHHDGNCQFCDNCKNPKESFEASAYIKLALEATLETDERFGIGQVIDVLMGKNTQYVKSYQHDKLNSFGKGKEKDEIFWKSVLRQILMHEFLEKNIENYGVLNVSEKGHEYIKNPTSFQLTKDHNYELLSIKEEEEVEDSAPRTGGHDEQLFKRLKDLRKDLADEMELPPFVIFQDPSLMEMATTYPTTEEELSHVSGVGMNKVKKFGEPFIEVIKEYVEENDIVTAADFVVKTAGNNSKNKIFIIQQVDRKIDFMEIAESRKLTMHELLEEMEHIVNSGTKLNIDYYIEDTIDEEKEDDIYDYFMNAETDDIGEAMYELEDEGYTEEEIRIIRIKFLSEVAN